MHRLLVALAIVVAGVTLAAVGSAHAALRWSPPRLIDGAAPFGDPTQILSSSCPTAGFCLGVGTNGTVVSASAAGAPKVVETGVDDYASLQGLSCPTTSLCVAVPISITSSPILTTTDPAASHPKWNKASAPVPFDSVDCPTASLCVALDIDGGIWTTTDPTDARTWKPTKLPSFTDVDVLTCAAGAIDQAGGALCVAAVENDNHHSELATTTDPTGGPAAWKITQAPVASPDVVAISCPSTALCVSISKESLVASSGDPAAGGSDWHVSQQFGAVASSLEPTAVLGRPDGIACSSSSLASCVAPLSNGRVITGSGSPAQPSETLSARIDSAGFGLTAEPGVDNLVACLPGATGNCLVSDQSGKLARILAPAPPAVPSSTATGVGGLNEISGLACPSASLCVAVDGDGAVLASTKPTGPASGWHRQVRSAGSLDGISCPSTSFCAAVSDIGTLVTSSAPRSGPWKSTKLPTAGLGFLTAISCASKALCVAAGDDSSRLLVSKRPAGGRRAWKEIQIANAVGTDHFNSVACPTTRLCIAGESAGQIAVSTAPARSWKLFKLHHSKRHRFSGPGFFGGQSRSFDPAPGTITAVTCAGPKLCLVGSQRGVLYSTANAAGGVKAFRPIKLSDRSIVGLSCRSSKLCVAIDAGGRAWSSSAPAQGASAWHPKRLLSHGFPLAGALTAVTCAPTKVCLAGDGGGNLYAAR